LTVAVGEGTVVVVGAVVGVDVDTLGVLVVVAELLELLPGKPMAKK
jgi:hypothetical protein